MLEYFDDEEWLRRQAEQSLGTVGPEATPEIPQADSAASERAKVLASMPELTALPARVDLAAARQSDADSGFQRGVERASKTLTRALAGVPRDVRDDDLVSQPGQAEAMALRDESRGRDDVMAQRQAQLQERQKVLGALLRPTPTAKVKSPEELEASRLRAEAAKSNAATYATRTESDAAIARERMAAQAARAAASASAGRTKAEAKAAEKKAAGAFKDSSGLRKEFSALPEVKSFKEASTSFEKIQRAAANPSAAGDLSLIFAYMKVLDPGSTVREGEFATAAAAAGTDQRLLGALKKVQSGERLTTEQRADFVRQAQQLYAAQQKQFTEQSTLYRRLAEKQGLDPDDVVAMAKKAAGGPDPEPEPMVRVRRKSDGVIKPIKKSTADKLGEGFEVLP